jgi:hypothetical protein
MTLRDVMESDVTDVFLNTDEHAESITYTPKGGTARTITAIIDEDAQFIATQTDAALADMAAIYATRDPLTGIDQPQLGDTITFTRSGLVIVWAWTGETGDADEFSWWLVFKRTRMERMGSNVSGR